MKIGLKVHQQSCPFSAPDGRQWDSHTQYIDCFLCEGNLLSKDF
jgi:hypothetical protein